MLLLSVPTNRLVVPALPVSFYAMEEKPRLRCLFSLCQKASTGTFCAVPVGSRGRLVLLPYPVAEALLSTSRRHRRGSTRSTSPPPPEPSGKCTSRRGRRGPWESRS